MHAGPLVQIDAAGRKEKYQTWVIKTEAGKPSAFDPRRTPKQIKLIENPLVKAVPIVLLTSDIDTKVKSPVSVMPKGLLDKLTREEILDLIAYLTARESAASAVPQRGPFARAFTLKPVACGLAARLGCKPQAAIRLIASAASTAAAAAAKAAAATATAAASSGSSAKATAAATATFFAGRASLTVNLRPLILDRAGLDCRLAFLSRAHLDKAEAFGATGVPVDDDLGRLHGPVLFEQILQIAVGHAIGKFPTYNFIATYGPPSGKFTQLLRDPPRADVVA